LHLSILAFGKFEFFFLFYPSISPKNECNLAFSPLIFTGSIQPIWPCDPTAGPTRNQGTFFLLESRRPSPPLAGLALPHCSPAATPIVVETMLHFLLLHFSI
jgi:hypothetical protein